MSKMHVKVGDTVMIITGKDAHGGKDGQGKTGKVLAVSPKEGKVIVEGCNIVKKHVKPRRMGEPGGIIEAEGALYASKVMHVDPKTGKPVRVGYRINDDGTKTRITVGKNASGSEI